MLHSELLARNGSTGRKGGLYANLIGGLLCYIFGSNGFDGEKNILQFSDMRIPMIKFLGPRHLLQQRVPTETITMTFSIPMAQLKIISGANLVEKLDFNPKFALSIQDELKLIELLSSEYTIPKITLEKVPEDPDIISSLS